MGVSTVPRPRPDLLSILPLRNGKLVLNFLLNANYQ